MKERCQTRDIAQRVRHPYVVASATPRIASYEVNMNEAHQPTSTCDPVLTLREAGCSDAEITAHLGSAGDGAIHLTLPYPVSANRYWRSYVPRGQQRAIVTLSDDAKAYKAEVAKIAKAHGLRMPLDGRIAITLRLFPARPQDWAKRAQRDPDGWDDSVRCIDLGNAEKVLSDALNGIAWVDDDQLRRIVLERMEPDDSGARVELSIARIRRSPVAPRLFV